MSGGVSAIARISNIDNASQSQSFEDIAAAFMELLKQLQENGASSGGSDSADSGRSYTIQPGDTLSEWAERTGVSVEELAAANNIRDPDLIYAGDELKVPDTAPQASELEGTSPDASSPDAGSPYAMLTDFNPAQAGLAEAIPARFSQGDPSGQALDQAVDLIKDKEGFRSTPYWDVNALRTGYGSDTVTDANGNVSAVNENTVVTEADATRDLKRRIGEFEDVARDQVGAAAWDSLPENAKAALISVAYNYGSLPNRIVDDVKTGDVERIAQAVEGLQSDDNGVNRQRRLDEAAYIRGS